MITKQTSLTDADLLAMIRDELIAMDGIKGEARTAANWRTRLEIFATDLRADREKAERWAAAKANV
jgi:hypothetical protein